MELEYIQMNWILELDSDCSVFQAEVLALKEAANPVTSLNIQSREISLTLIVKQQ